MATLSPNRAASPRPACSRCRSAATTCRVGRPRREAERSITSSWIRANRCSSSSAAATRTSCGWLSPRPPATAQPQWASTGPQPLAVVAGPVGELADEVDPRAGRGRARAGRAAGRPSRRRRCPRRPGAAPRRARRRSSRAGRRPHPACRRPTGRGGGRRGPGWSPRHSSTQPPRPSPLGLDPTRHLVCWPEPRHRSPSVARTLDKASSGRRAVDGDLGAAPLDRTSDKYRR